MVDELDEQLSDNTYIEIDAESNLEPLEVND